MPVVLLVQSVDEAERLSTWGVRCAKARGTRLQVLHAMASADPGVESLDWNKEKLPPPLSELRRRLGERDDVVPYEPEGSDETPPDSVPVELVTVSHADPTAGVLEHLAAVKARLLVYCRGNKESDASEVSAEEVYARAGCETLALRSWNVDSTAVEKILVPVDDRPFSSTALRLAVDLAGSSGSVCALHVESESGSFAERVGHRHLDRIVERALDERAAQVERRVVSADRVSKGLAMALEQGEYGLVLSSARREASVRRLLYSTVPEDKVRASEGVAIGVVRPGIPWASRLRQSFEFWVRATVPQLEREQRVSLFERVQSSSHWNFDFVALIGLSTLIAALGLAANSAAVVIGAMLVAPLMTPILGVGLALAHGNPVLARNALRTVLRGFLLAFAVGAASRLLVPELGEATGEMLARTAPSRLDLFVAFASGIAAAYASGRPGLLSALPGVAIAAALVPPIASSGLLMTLGFFPEALGALLLFGTNFIAIALGSSMSLWAVGIRGDHLHGRGQLWSVTGGIVLSVATILLGAGLGSSSKPVAPEVTQAIEKALAEVNQEATWTAQNVYEGGEHRWVIVLSVNDETDRKKLAERLVRRIDPLVDEPVEVKVRLEWEARSEDLSGD